jgi:hypothetical protein
MYHYGTTPGRRRTVDRHVMFVVRYRDGAHAYMRIEPSAVQFGSQLVPTIALERQRKGELPNGEIVEIVRAR